jgi:hypothetical protein
MSTSTSGFDARDSAPRSDASIGELFVDVSKDVSLLIRQEVELAKAELKESAVSAGKGAGMLGGAGITGHLAVIFLSVAVWWGLGDAIGRGWSGLVVAAFWLIVAAVLGLLGRSALKSVKGLPQTAGTVKKIPDAMKGNEAVR